MVDLGTLEPLTAPPVARGSGRVTTARLPGDRRGSGQIWLLLGVLMLLGIGAIVFIGLRW